MLKSNHREQEENALFNGTAHILPETLMPLGGGVKPACSLRFERGLLGLGVYKFISLEENCVFPRPLWERAGERGQAGLGEKKFRSLDEVFLYSSLFNPQAPLPEIRDFDPPTRGGLSLITWSLDHPVTSPKDCRGAATLRNASNKCTLHTSRFTLYALPLLRLLFNPPIPLCKEMLQR